MYDPAEVSCSTVQPLSVRRWSLNEWLGSEAVWSELLGRTAADPLFLSWDWLTLWWQFFAEERAFQPWILAFYRGERLVAIAPFYRTRVTRGRLLYPTSVQFIGHSWRDSSPLISEYLDVIAPPEELAEVRAACVEVLLREDAWRELVIGYTETATAWRELLARNTAGHYARELDRSVSFQADLTAGFAAYRRALGQSTRRSVWNLRRRLQALGPVRVERLAGEYVAQGFDDLNRLHLLRWHKPAFAGKRLDFHRQLATRLAARGELSFTRLWVGGRVVSALYDIRRGSRQYNLKLGFDPGFERQFSLGLLHLGYALEAAAAEGVATYDFLAGPGQKADYKTHLSQSQRELCSLQILRGRVLPRLYRWYDRRTQGKAAADTRAR